MEDEEEEEEVGAMITQQGFLCGKCSSEKGNSSNLATQPGNPNMEVSREACIFSLYISNSKYVLAVAQRGVTQSLAALTSHTPTDDSH